MQTPICDFVKKYVNEKTLRLHMPGHKGTGILGYESADITEIDGADCLFSSSGIIAQSEKNTSELFNAHTFFSTEGSSLCIKAMLYLVINATTHQGKKPLIAAGRNAHNAFINAAALLDFDVDWLLDSEQNSYISCKITKQTVSDYLSKAKVKPCAIYITSPDYLGNTTDIKSISEVCKKHDVFLLVDNAHGAYLKFLKSSLHPMDCGADMCCDSAHKTLPCLTGGAYLHVSNSAPIEFSKLAKTALSLFGSTSPSYLILQSLDLVNKYLSQDYFAKLNHFVEKVNSVKQELVNSGYTLLGDEPLKITIQTKNYGYLGSDFYKVLKNKGLIAEFSDCDFIVLMLSPDFTDTELLTIKTSLQSIPKLASISQTTPKFKPLKSKLSIRQALFSQSEEIPVEKAAGRILSCPSISCPPAIPLIVGGEIIDENAIDGFNYYNQKTCRVVKE